MENYEKLYVLIRRMRTQLNLINARPIRKDVNRQAQLNQKRQSMLNVIKYFLNATHALGIKVPDNVLNGLTTLKASLQRGTSN